MPDAILWALYFSSAFLLFVCLWLLPFARFFTVRRFVRILGRGDVAQACNRALLLVLPSFEKRVLLAFDMAGIAEPDRNDLRKHGSPFPIDPFGANLPERGLGALRALNQLAGFKFIADAQQPCRPHTKVQQSVCTDKYSRQWDVSSWFNW